MSNQLFLPQLKLLEAGSAASFGEANPHPTVGAVLLAGGAIHHIYTSPDTNFCHILLPSWALGSTLLLDNRPLLL